MEKPHLPANLPKLVSQDRDKEDKISGLDI